MAEKVPTKEDEEITGLLTKLYAIQEDIGAKPKTTDEQKRVKAENLSKMGTGKKGEKTGSRFLELKSKILDRLKDSHKLLKASRDLETDGYGGDNAKEIIKMQAEIRENVRQATEEWRSLEQIYKKEARKKKSKFTDKELEVQSELVTRLYSEIEKVKQAQTQGYAKKDTSAGIYGAKKYKPNKKNKNPTWAGTGQGGVDLTTEQSAQIQMLEDRDRDFDLQLDEIGEGILDLQEIAQQQQEEVMLQGQMLDKVERKIDKNVERMSTVNGRMKETLEEVGRASDKIMVDILCIVLMIGFGAVIYNFAK